VGCKLSSSLIQSPHFVFSHPDLLLDQFNGRLDLALGSPLQTEVATNRQATGHDRIGTVGQSDALVLWPCQQEMSESVMHLPATSLFLRPLCAFFNTLVAVVKGGCM
jgi:hypothetical protein